MPVRRAVLRRRVAALAVLCLAVPAIPAPAQAADRFVPFAEFLDGVSAAGPADAPAEVAAMRAHLRDLYDGVRVDRSFVLGGYTFDCVEYGTQPGLRDAPPAARTMPTPAVRPAPAVPAGVTGARSWLTLGARDHFGNAISCADGYVPIRRLGLDELTSYRTLRQAQLRGHGAPGAAAPSRHYSYGHQEIANLGGSAYLNLWEPARGFSLSQQWFRANGNQQTLEGGWVKMPGGAGNPTTLFVFFTPDNYASGCYNVECRGFVQTSNKWALGARFPEYSKPDGRQVGFTFDWKLVGDKWWMSVAGDGGTLEQVGYYPTSAYRGGPLAKGATTRTSGGEVAPGGSSWPPMGSGRFAADGAGKAAYQSNIVTYPAGGGPAAPADYKPIETASRCFTIRYTPADAGGDRGTNFYYGGPGGSC